MVKPVVVVGAGLSGLICARKLHQSGVPVLVVDADDRPGGRLKTDVVDGFKLDRGFQVLLTAYPTTSREIDLSRLSLGAFQPGALIYHGGRLTLLEDQSFLEMLQAKFAPAKDKTMPVSDNRLLGNLASSVGKMSVRQAYSSQPMATEDFLIQFGFSEAAIDRFFRPLLGGLFLDSSLQFDSRQFKFVWAMLSQGKMVLPADGIQAIADQIAADIPRYLFRLGNRVSEVLRDEKGNPSGVRFDTSETLAASCVVVATEGDVAAELVGLPTHVAFKSSTCLYFETPTPFVESAHLALNGSDSGIVNHVAPVSNVSPSYAPPGKHLASVSLRGSPEGSDQELAEQVKQELSVWAPHKGAYMWRFIRAYRTRFAQMAQPVGFLEHRPTNATNKDGLYWAGEFTQNSSIEGAVRSGLECAALILSNRGALEAA
jgi:phytoene dehydrogenase-like protein